MLVGSCPVAGVAEQGHHDPRRGRAGQAATAGRLTERIIAHEVTQTGRVAL